MLVIRLARTGRKKQPNYRVVVADKRAPVQGRFVEVLGHYNPRTKEVVIDVDRAKARLAEGAQPSETAAMLLQRQGAMKRDEITEKNRRPERTKKKKVEEAASATQEPADGDTPEEAADAGAKDKAGDSGDEAPAEKPVAKKEPEKKAEEAVDEKPAAKDSASEDTNKGEGNG